MSYQLWLVQEILNGRYKEIAKATIDELKKYDNEKGTWYAYYLDSEDGVEALAELLQSVANKPETRSI